MYLGNLGMERSFQEVGREENGRLRTVEGYFQSIALDSRFSGRWLGYLNVLITFHNRKHTWRSQVRGYLTGSYRTTQYVRLEGLRQHTRQRQRVRRAIEFRRVLQKCSVG